MVRRTLRHIVTVTSLLLAGCPLSALAAATGAGPTAVTGVRWQASDDVTVVRIDFEGASPPRLRHARQSRPDRIVVELTGARLQVSTRPALIVDRLLADVRITETRPGTVEVTLELWRPIPYEVTKTVEGLEIVLGRGGVAEASQEPTTAPMSTHAQAQAPAAGTQEAPAQEGQAAPAPPAEEPAPPTTEFSAEERFTLQYQNVRGNTSLSFLNQGLHYIQELDFGFKHRLSPDTTFEGTFSSLLSDDFKVAPDQFLLQSFQLKLTAPTYEIAAGDVFTTLSPLTLSQPVKGLGGWKEFPVLAGLRFTLIGGVIKTRWDELWDDEPGEQRTRFVGGVRIEQRLTPDVAIGVNYFRARDDTGRVPGSVPSPPPLVEGTPTSLFDLPPPPPSVFGSLPPVSNQVVSADLKLRLLGIVTVDAEAARSWVDLDVTAPPGRQHDEAYSVNVGVNYAGLRATGRYLRVEPRFFSGGSFVVADQEEFSVRADYDFPSWATVGAGYIDTRDNLDGKKPATIRSKTPVVRLSLRDLPYLGSLLLDLRSQVRLTDASNDSVDEKTWTSGLDATYRLGPLSLAANYEHQEKYDSVNRNRRGRVDLIGASAQAQFPLWGLTVSPTLRYEFLREGRLREGTKETTQRYEAGLTLDWPERAVLALGYQLWDTDAFFPTEGLVKWGARAELRIRLWKRDDRTLTLSYERRDNDYADKSRNYLEEILTTKLVLRY